MFHCRFDTHCNSGASEAKKSKVDAGMSGLGDLLTDKDGLMTPKDSSSSAVDATVARRKDMSKGRTLKTTMVISIGDSATGGRKTIQVNRLEACSACAASRAVGAACQQCRGERTVSVQVNVQVDLPPGVMSGFSAVVAGAGDAAEDVLQMPGDLIVEVQVRPHAFLRRLGNDCHAELPLSFSQATLGCKLRIPSLYGQTMLTIPPGTQSHSFISVADEGFPIPHTGNKKGSMMVKVLVLVPKNVTPEEAALLRQFDKSVKERAEAAEAALEARDGEKNGM